MTGRYGIEMRFGGEPHDMFLHWIYEWHHCRWYRTQAIRDYALHVLQAKGSREPCQAEYRACQTQRGGAID